MKNLIQDTLARIKQEYIAPEPRWKFLARRFGVWMALGLIVLLGALSISVAYYLLANLDWEMPGFRQQNIFNYGLTVFPYFWLVFLGAFVAVAFLGVRKTETGYRFNWWKIMGSIVGGIFLVGLALSVLGVNRQLNRSMMQNIPYYAAHTITKETQWMQPEKGFLAGTIVSVSGNILLVKDLNESDWSIYMDEKTLVRPSVDISIGRMIKIIGVRQDAHNFTATEIRPWVGRGMMEKGNQGETCPAETLGACNNRGGGMMGR